MSYCPLVFDDDTLDMNYSNCRTSCRRSNCCPELPIDEIHVIDCEMDNDCNKFNSCSKTACCPKPVCCMSDECVSNTCGPCKTQPIGLDQEPCIDKNGWKVWLDVSSYQPEDITVRAENNKIIVHAQRELECGLSCVLNEFTREYELPKEYNMDDVVLCFSCDCILIISVPMVQYRVFPIQSCGPARCFINCNKNTAQKSKNVE